MFVTLKCASCPGVGVGGWDVCVCVCTCISIGFHTLFNTTRSNISRWLGGGVSTHTQTHKFFLSERSVSF